MISHWCVRTGSDWWFSKIMRIRTGSDSIFANQDGTRTEIFVSPLISVVWWSVALLRYECYTSIAI